MKPLSHNPLGGGGDPLTLPGHVIIKGDLGQKFDFADVLAARYLRRAWVAAEGQPQGLADRIIARADMVIAHGAFRVGGTFFHRGVEDEDMVPAMLWCNLRVQEPGITLAECSALVTEDNVRAIKLALWRAWGYSVRDPKAVAPSAEGTPAGSEGPPIGMP